MQLRSRAAPLPCVSFKITVNCILLVQLFLLEGKCWCGTA